MKHLIETFLEMYNSENTKRRYKAVLLGFSEFVGGNLLETTVEDVFEYHDKLKKRDGIEPRLGGSRKLSGRTLKNTFEIINSFFNHAVKRGRIKFNPVERADVRLPHIEHNEKRATQIVDFDEVMTVCNGPSRHTKRGIRDRAILACLFGGGLRKSEVIKLNLADVMVNKKGLYLLLRNTKSGKTQTQALPDWASERVTRLLEVRKSEKAEAKDSLVVNYRTHKEYPVNKPMPISTFDEIFYKWRNQAGISSYISPHSARATAISQLLALKIPIRDVQIFARHESVRTTEQYDKRYLGYGKEVAEKLSYN